MTAGVKEGRQRCASEVLEKLGKGTFERQGWEMAVKALL